jgi:molybdenum cofactor guanylyltransferase
MKCEKDSHNRLKASAVILAGGSGTRMGGISKSDLILENTTFITRKIRFTEQICSEIIISVAAETGEFMLDSFNHTAVDIPIRIVRDESKGHGPLMGILSALKVSQFEVNFITTVDSPIISIPFAEYLIQGLGDNDAHVPIWNGYPEPLFAVYQKSCIPYIQESIMENRRKIVSFYDKISVKYADSEVVKGYDADGSSFTNINTQEEYRKLLESQRW